MIERVWKKIISQSYWRLAWIIILVFLATIFLYLKVVPSGQIIYSRSWPRGLSSGQGFIYDFKPGERLDISDPNRLKMIGDPLYFSLFTPRSFDRAEVTVRYREHLSSATPIVELGVLKNKLTGAYELQPLENRWLDWLSQDWFKLEQVEGEEERLLFLQNKDNYQTVEEFLVDLQNKKLKSCLGGPTTCLAVYNYPWTASYSLPTDTAVSPLHITQPFRGSHQFYVYLPVGPWRFFLELVDLNLDKAPDPVIVTVSDNQGQSSSEELFDDNPLPASGRSENKELAISGQAQTAGLYKVQIKASDDIVVSSLSSPSDKLSFINKFWPVSESAENLKLYTDSSYLQIKTFNPASLGPVVFGDDTFTIDETYRQFNLFRSGGGKISLSNEDLVLETNGVFALSQESIINPQPNKVDRFFRPKSDTTYIIARYQAPEEKGGIKESRAVLDLTGADREEGRYQFLLSIPGLGVDTPGSWLEIEEISVRLEGRTLWQKIKSWIRK